jgi:hypothetical protein
MFSKKHVLSLGMANGALQASTHPSTSPRLPKVGHPCRRLRLGTSAFPSPRQRLNDLSLNLHDGSDEHCSEGSGIEEAEEEGFGLTGGCAAGERLRYPIHVLGIVSFVVKSDACRSMRW